MLKRLGFILMCTFLFWSCGESRRELFRLNMEADFIIPSGSNTIETYYNVIANVPTFFSSFSENSEEALNTIGTINASSCVLQGKFQSYEMDFIEDITITMIDPNDPSNRAEIFYLEYVKIDAATEIQLFPSLPDTKNIISNDFVALEVKYNLRRSSPGTVENQLLFTLIAFEPE